MLTPPVPADEVDRLRELRALGILDTGAEERFDRITRMAARLFRVPISLVSLVDADRQWFKSRYGLDATESPRAISFCAHTLPTGKPLVVEDARRDERFADNPAVADDPNVRFYAGVPIEGPGGHRLGTFCVVDTKPRAFSEDELEVLQDLAAIVQSEIHDSDARAAREEARRRAAELAARERELELLKRLDDERRAFVNGAAHAFRTPLTPLAAQVEALKVLLGHDERVRAAAERIDRQVRHMTRLVDRMQKVAALQAGNVAAAPEHTPLRPTAERAWERARLRCGNTTTRLDNRVPPERTAHISPAHLEQVLFELMANALHAAPEADRLSVTTRKTPRGIAIRIRDRGPGMPDDAQTWFSGFGGGTGARPMHQGAGFGLVIASGMARLYGGRVTFDTHEAGGTVAHLELPREAETANTATI